MNWKKILKVLAAIGVCQIAGIVGSIFTMPAIPTWYASLRKPSFAPPGSVIGIIWITLYTLMGISLYLVWESKDSKWKKPALAVFGVQLFLNALWSFLFFGLKSTGAGLIAIIVLWISIAATIYYFLKISKPAAYLLIPYIIWVTIAALLNFLIHALNCCKVITY